MSYLFINSQKVSYQLKWVLAAILNKNANLSLFDELPQVDNQSFSEISKLDYLDIKSELTTIPTPPVSKITPRDWQDKTIELVNNAINTGENRILISAATGAGKAMLLMFIIQKMLQCNKRVLLLIDRIKLVNQLCEDASKFGFKYNLIQGSNKLINHDNLLTIASIQSYFSQDYELEFDYIIQDEAHSQYAKLTELLTKFSGVAIGCTATPTTKGLKRIYPYLIESITHNQLIKDNVLVPLFIKELKQIDMTTARILAGEWLAEEVVERCQIGFDNWIIESILSYTPSRSIAFCANIEHCEQLKDRLAGQINAAVYTSMQNAAEREQILKDYDDHKIDMLITVATLSKGFNRPDITTIIDLRPLRESITEYIQIIGRGTRIFDGKTECVVLDFTGNWNRFRESIEKIQRSGSKSAYELTWTGIDEIVSQHKVNRRKAEYMAHDASQEGLIINERIKQHKQTILELDRLIRLEKENKPIKKLPPPPPIKKVTLWGKFKQLIRT
jgi:superfamily II DNA or RNA helicase